MTSALDALVFVQVCVHTRGIYDIESAQLSFVI